MSEQGITPPERGSPVGADYLSEIIKSVSGSAVSDSTPPQTASTAASGGSGSSDLFSSLLSNPELIAKLPTIISSIKPIIELLSARQTPDKSATAVPTAAHESPRPPEAPNISHGKDSLDRRAALLCAMKPYLSRERCQAIDYILKLSRLGDILKTL